MQSEDMIDHSQFVITDCVSSEYNVVNPDTLKCVIRRGGSRAVTQYAKVIMFQRGLSTLITIKGGHKNIQSHMA